MIRLSNDMGKRNNFAVTATVTFVDINKAEPAQAAAMRKVRRRFEKIFSDAVTKPAEEIARKESEAIKEETGGET